jgi:glycine oxidase
MIRFAVIGAGVIGRLTAWRLSELGEVTLFEKNKETDDTAASFVGAGLISPWSELDYCEPQIKNWGMTSLSLWKDYLALLKAPPFFQTAGTLVVSHQRDFPDLDRLKNRLEKWVPESEYEWVTQEKIGNLEPELDKRFLNGIFIPGEAQVENRDLMHSLKKELETKAQIHFDSEVTHVKPFGVEIKGDNLAFDWVIDCRGLGARSLIRNLRGVRGEIIRVQAHEVNLNRPIRLIHPKYPLYIAPRADHHFVIGATQIESESKEPITVRSALELLSAAFSIHSGFAEAKIKEMASGLRPALPDHLPCLNIQKGFAELNGFYRHGFLLGPYFVEKLFLALKEMK